MDKRQRAMLFSRYVGLELKGKITARGYTAKAVALAAQRSPAAFNRWLNGRVELPLAVLCEACEVIGVEPQVIVDLAYSRVVVEYGPAESARVQAADAGVAGKRAGARSDVGAFPDDVDIPRAAKKGARKTDVGHTE
ncbi:MAG: helix-turn-helix domain-containing protein [Humibacter sp.]